MNGPGFNPQFQSCCFDYRFSKRARFSEPMPSKIVSYKTVMCINFSKGRCSYADRCHFAHSARELRHDGGSVVGKRESWVNRSDSPRVDGERKICFRFVNGEQCPYGDRCWYLHEGCGWNVKGDSGLNTGRAVEVVSVGEEDRKRKGVIADRVNQKVSFWRTRLCKRFETTGGCPMGLNCNYAHGVSALRKVAIPTNDAPSNGIEVAHKMQGKGEQTAFKLKNFPKISGIYGDWIDPMPLVRGSPGKVAV